MSPDSKVKIHKEELKVFCCEIQVHLGCLPEMTYVITNLIQGETGEYVNLKNTKNIQVSSVRPAAEKTLTQQDVQSARHPQVIILTTGSS